MARPFNASGVLNISYQINSLSGHSHKLMYATGVYTHISIRDLATTEHKDLAIELSNNYVSV